MIADYFTPLSSETFFLKKDYPEKTLGNCIDKYLDDFPRLDNYDLAIIGIDEDRQNSNNWGCGKGADFIRQELYKLFQIAENQRILDLGNILPGIEVRDTYFGIKDVCNHLMSRNILPIILGGSHDLTYAQYMAYEDLDQLVEMMVIDNKPNIGAFEMELNANNFLTHIFSHYPSYLFNFFAVGHQQYLVNPDDLDFLEEFYFDAISIGQLLTDIKEFEPLIRSIDLLSFDVASLRISEAAGSPLSSPNGFFGDEACQLMRYAGLSDKLSSLGIYEYNPTFDKNGQTAALLAQMIWYFIEGYYSRLNDIPSPSHPNFLKYIASFDAHEHQIVFYKSKRSDRWWMEIPMESKSKNAQKSHLIPCSYEDYKIATMDQEIPDRFLRYQNKLANSKLDLGANF